MPPSDATTVQYGPSDPTVEVRPVHFHTQAEYIESLQGKVGLEIEGREVVLAPADGRFDIRPYTVKFLLSGARTDNASELNPIFFENWYKYQDDVVVNGKWIDLIQVFCMFDAGGTYLSLPPWIPFGQAISITLGVVLGRWIGGLLGYQPFYKKWTSDWELACQKMEASVFQRRFAVHDKED
ncbi:hypothetical protein NEMBOFW57_001451 [Staphylotrichum longicolle]|uniref:Uncharacterized protein n=1 Tax=Staphylotrichum longicolle TaxID=669026 RepID=A0AAD4F1H9_9PEZI|nr:hypothetical protein NEMBOFW57_001451 [Staphylotrichum longicolle]